MTELGSDMDLDQVPWLWQNKAVELNVANSGELVSGELVKIHLTAVTGWKQNYTMTDDISTTCIHIRRQRRITKSPYSILSYQ